MTTVIYGNPHGRDFYLFDDTRVYMESGKKSPGMPQSWKDGELPEVGIHEGIYILNMLMEYSQYLIDHESKLFEKTYFMFAGASEYPPKARAAAVNLLLPHIDDDVIYIEPHCNASGNDWSDAQGHKVFYNEAARKYAMPLSRHLKLNKAPDTRERAPKLAPRGWWLDELNCPGMYAEMFFMTNEYETKISQHYLGIQGYYQAFEQFHLEVDNV